MLADVYKATWDEGMHPSEVERRVYGTKSEAAREGMRMLLNEGVTMRSMVGRDWDYLVSLCDPDVQAAYARRPMPGSPFTKFHMGLRQTMDVYLANYIVADWIKDDDVLDGQYGTAYNSTVQEERPEATEWKPSEHDEDT